ncbi:putative RlpA-like domain superfamily, kiwellin [Helianthus debilis subsp. tardiflorus]
MKQSTVIFAILFFTLFISCIHALTNVKATMTINSFEEGGSGGGPSECDGRYHSQHTDCGPVHPLVVDECDSTRGCKNNIVDASEAVWKALHVPKSEWGETTVTWSDA